MRMKRFIFVLSFPIWYIPFSTVCIRNHEHSAEGCVLSCYNQKSMCSILWIYQSYFPLWKLDCMTSSPVHFFAWGLGFLTISLSFLSKILGFIVIHFRPFFLDLFNFCFSLIYVDSSVIRWDMRVRWGLWSLK